MTSSISLPVETWQAILRHAIFVPDFLDADSFEGDLQVHGFGDHRVHRDNEGVYWEAEKIRDKLQLVCTGWNKYLRDFAHRYVRMSDVWHGRIDTISLKGAIRISLRDWQCECAEVCLPPPSEGLLGLYRRFGAFSAERIYEFTFLSAEILDMGGVYDRVIWNSGALRSLSRLKTVISWGFSGDGIDYPLFCQSPNLAHVRAKIYDDILYRVFVSKTLSTLSIELGMNASSRSTIWDLPSLKHLRITHSGRSTASGFLADQLLPLLRRVGSQLHSLYITTRHQYDVPVDIWELCPLLEKFHPGMRLLAPPYSSHPIHTISVSTEHFMDSFMLSLQWPNLQRIIFDGRWMEVLDSIEAILLQQRSSSRRAWKLEDRDGVLLEDFVNQIDI